MIPKNIKMEDFYYNRPPTEEIESFLKKFDILLSLFTDKVGIDKKSIFYNIPLLISIYVRINQRFDYYQYFHSKEDRPTLMSQVKEIALMCYWIIKYKPLFQNRDIMQDYFKDNFCTINEMFVLFVIKSFVLSINDGKDKKVLNFFDSNNNYVMIYNFMHRDISKESFILYVTSLVKALEV